MLIKNPIKRYLINSPMLPNLKKNDDGSLTVYIQKVSPGADRESNWLPAPDGPIYMAIAPLLAENRAAFNPATGRRNMATAGHDVEAGEMIGFKDLSVKPWTRNEPP